DSELLLCHGMVCVVGRMRDLILQLSKSSIYSTKPGNGGRERIGETGTVLGLNARDSKHAGRMFSMHNCQINPGAGPEITTPWKSYQHEKNRNGLMPLIRRRTMLQL
ncbi:DUF4049 domain-containing protein, partial [Escherichia coli]|uniref:DUF4049 domain-containing protein n=1 Tax=Escherichia coli TaxID=562 RepID=UPI0024E11A9C